MAIIKNPLTIVRVSPTPSGFTVTLTDNGDGSYAVYDGQDENGTFLVQVDHGTSETVTCTSGYLYLYVVESFSSYSSSAGINLVGQGSGVHGGLDEYLLYQVTADGTITAESYW